MLRLLLANIALRPARTALTALAVIASSCIVVWVVSGYDALIARSIDEEAAEALGRFDLVVSADGGGPGGGRRPGGPAAVGLPPDLVAALKEDDRVAEANLTTRSRVSVGRAAPGPDAGAGPMARLFRDDRPPVHGMPPLDPPLIGTDAAEPPYEMVAGRWIDPAAGGRAEGVLSADFAEGLGVGAGDEVSVVSEVGEWTVTLVGVVEQPRSGGAGPGGGADAQSGLFVPLAMAEEIDGHPAKITRINLALEGGIDPASYGEALSGRLSGLGVPAAVADLGAIRGRMAAGLSRSGSRALAYSATGIALMAALFIIFTTLSMGVSERGRELAVLRAVGMTRGQVAGMVVLEGLALAVLGWAGGLAAGRGLLAVVSRATPGLFPDGAALGPWCVGLTAAAAVGGALAAAVLPAWRAARVMPLDAMTPPRAVPPSRWGVPAGLAGLALLAINPVLTHVLPMGDSARAWAYALVGYPGMVLGFVLLAPAAIVLVEGAAGPAVARLLGLPPRLLASILSANLWRTLGTTVALTVGLGLYVATQTWGYSMLVPYTPGDWVPELLVGFEPSGLPDEQVGRVGQADGVTPGRCLPMAVEQPGLVDRVEGPGNSILAQDNVVLIGLDPALAFGGDDPMIAAEFTDGDRASALTKLEAGGACLVPDHFLDSTGMAPGDTLELVPPGGPPGAVVGYEIVGAVSLPGWHWMTKMTGLRRRSTRTAALVFAPIADVRRDFRVDRVNFFWLEADGSASPEQVEAEMQRIAEQHGETTFHVAGVGEVTSRRPYARLTAAGAVRAGISDRADDMIWGMSQLPLVTLLITSLAVVNTIVSSVRARRWELGVLRATGTTRGGLIRLILAESILIGLVVGALGLAFGVMAGWCGTGMAPSIHRFGGMSTPLVLPWARIALGLATTLGLCLLAAAWPAIAAGRSEPLALLKAGRGAA
ncbi:ABC transporter permease [Tautonia sp. JC769]|uniref:ABC transporter permease n=1 Tax=Tautonia sp. JC769 TaxID=3232135 RepID=UPI0034575841